MENEKQEFVRTTRINPREMTSNLKMLFLEREKYNFDLTIQRGDVWTDYQRSLFVHTIIYGFPFPPAFAEESKDGTIDLLDGKQRLTTIFMFMNDELVLHKDTPNCLGFELAKKKYSDLPQSLRDYFDATSFTIVEMPEMTADERDEMFQRLNKGTPLSGMELIRAEYSALIPQLEELSSLEFFIDYVKQPTKRFADQGLILQIAMILDTSRRLKSIGNKDISNYVATLKKEKTFIPEDVKNKIVTASEYLAKVMSDFNQAELKMILKKVHVPMIINTALIAIADEVQPEQFKQFLEDFYINNYNPESNYGVAVRSETSKKSSITIRLTELERAYNAFKKKGVINFENAEVVKSEDALLSQDVDQESENDSKADNNKTNTKKKDKSNAKNKDKEPVAK